MSLSTPLQESPPSTCPLSHTQHDSLSFANYSSCPVGQGADPICPSNLIPTDLETGSGRSTLRVTSSIPRSGMAQAAPATTTTDTSGHVDSSGYWKYPSPAMFYAAVERKGHTGALAALKENPADLETIVHIHNIVNEKAWQQVLAYEKYHQSAPLSPTATPQSNGPKLKRFIGRPNELSPKAHLLSQLFGYQRPFDRHDWYVERDNGTIVRYIIDFYAGPPKTIPGPPLEPQASITVPSIYLDVRPELSFEGLLDRLRMKLSSLF